MKNVVEVIVRGLMQHSGAVLFCRNIKNQYLYLPGGHVEFGEPLRVALAREFVEETGMTVKVGDLIASAEATFTHKGSLHHEITLTFHVKHPSRRSRPEVISRERKIDFIWVPLTELHKWDVRPPSTRRLLRRKPALVHSVFDSDLESKSSVVNK